MPPPCTVHGDGGSEVPWPYGAKCLVWDLVHRKFLIWTKYIHIWKAQFCNFKQIRRTKSRKAVEILTPESLSRPHKASWQPTQKPTLPLETFGTNCRRFPSASKRASPEVLPCDLHNPETTRFPFDAARWIFPLNGMVNWRTTAKR